MTLLVVDTQCGIMREELYGYDIFRKNIISLITAARECGVEVIYVRHDDGEGQPLHRGRAEFEIFPDFAPMADERIFDKYINSPFRDTGLTEYLNARGETTLMVTGLQTDYCIDATVKCGFEHGFEIIVPAHANTTFDNSFMSAQESYRYYNEYIWKGRYALCVSADEAVSLIRGASES